MTPALNALTVPLPPGLTAVTGDEGTGKTLLLHSLLRRLQGDGSAQAQQWLDLDLPTHDEHTPAQVWAALRAHSPQWDAPLHQQLLQALALLPHQGLKLNMLSTGSRRKVALAGLLASGATVTCLDQPYAALDAASIRVVQQFLAEMAQHPSRSWVVADYEADPCLPWRQVIALG